MKKEAAVFRAQKDEERASGLLRRRWWNNAWHPPTDDDVAKAKQLLLDAAESWHIAGNTSEEQRVRAKAYQTPAKNPFDQFDAVARGSGAKNPRPYRVTGLVLEVNNRIVAFQRGADRWEVARDSNTKVAGDLKVGATVTITYTMTATEVAVKPYISVDPNFGLGPKLKPSDFPDQPQNPR
jgi:hypothetical protein